MRTHQVQIPRRPPNLPLTFTRQVTNAETGTSRTTPIQDSSLKHNQAEKSSKTSPDLGSGRGVLFSYSFLALNQHFRSAQTSPLQAPTSQTCPEQNPPSRTIPEKLEKNLSIRHETASSGEKDSPRICLKHA